MSIHLALIFLYDLDSMGLYWFGEINGKRHFQISNMANESYIAIINSEQGYYGILEKAKSIAEAKRFSEWVGRALDHI